MARRWSVRKEPVLWVAAAIGVLSAVQAYLTKAVDVGTAVNLVLVAVGGVVVRSKVTPVATLPVELADPGAGPSVADESGLLGRWYDDGGNGRK